MSIKSAGLRSLLPKESTSCSYQSDTNCSRSIVRHLLTAHRVFKIGSTVFEEVISDVIWSGRFIKMFSRLPPFTSYNVFTIISSFTKWEQFVVTC